MEGARTHWLDYEPTPEALALVVGALGEVPKGQVVDDSFRLNNIASCSPEATRALLGDSYDKYLQLVGK